MNRLLLNHLRRAVDQQTMNELGRRYLSRLLRSNPSLRNRLALSTVSTTTATSMPLSMIGVCSSQSIRHASSAKLNGNPPPNKYDASVYQRVEDDEDRDIRLMNYFAYVLLFVGMGVIIFDRCDNSPKWSKWTSDLKNRFSEYNINWINNDDLLVTFDVKPKDPPK